MRGSFACPECGGIVKLRGLAPGRQVRCRFCQQLLEIPFLPRVPAASGKRRGSGWPKWVVWAWSAVGLALAVILVWGSLRYWRKHQQSVLETSIHKLIESSHAQEHAGHLNEALIDLDAMLELAQKASESHREMWEAQRKRRQDLARREVEETLDRLVRHGPSSFPLGNWLNLIARSEHDLDLESLKPRVVQRFRSVIGQYVDAELSSARRSFDSGQVVVALQSCDRIATLLVHLDPDRQQARRHETEELVTRLLARRGVVVEPTHGDFVFGSESSYTSSLVPVAVKALEAKAYLPYRARSPWADLWKHAMYRLEIHVSEHQEGFYPSSQSRLTLIRVHLVLTAHGVQKWQTFPGARARVPLPNLPTYQSGGLAFQSERSEEFERLLYKDALGQADEKVGLALTNLPACPP
jgi:hypothetical protein